MAQKWLKSSKKNSFGDAKSTNVSRFGGFWGSLACALGWPGGPDLAPPTIYGAPRAHGPSKTARFTMFCGGGPAKTRVSARFGAEIARFTWFSKGTPAKTRVLAGFCLEIDECIAFWRVFGEGPEMGKSLKEI